MVKRIVGLIVVAVLLMSCSSAGIASVAFPKQFSIGACGTGGTMYLIGAGISRVIEKVHNVPTTVEVTACAIENLKLLDNNKVDIVLLTPEVADQAYRGIGLFDKKKIEYRAVFPQNPQYCQMIVLADSPIKSVQDLRGKRVSVGAPGSGILESNRMFLSALGIEFTDFTPEYLSMAETGEAMKDGTVDAALIVTSAPSSWVLDLESVKPVRLLEFSDEELKILEEKVPYYTPSILPKGRYQSQDYDVKTFEMWNVVGVRKDMPDDVAYEITKAIMENNDELVKVHREGAYIRPENASHVKIPFHPGAARYYQEVGITVPTED